jgi:hypothetical protein
VYNSIFLFTIKYSNLQLHIPIYNYIFRFTISDYDLQFRIPIYNFRFRFTIPCSDLQFQIPIYNSRFRFTIPYSYLQFRIPIYNFRFRFTIPDSDLQFQIPIYKNTTFFEIFQLKISEDALYEENDGVTKIYFKIILKFKILIVNKKLLRQPKKYNWTKDNGDEKQKLFSTKT